MVMCNYCGKQAEYVGGSTLYPHRKDLYAKRFWFCRPCDAYVGCKSGTSEPSGILANKKLRDFRMKAHNRFDMLWRNGIMSRSDAYQWLSSQLNLSPIECHIGQFDIGMCKRVIIVMDKWVADNYELSKRV